MNKSSVKHLGGCLCGDLRFEAAAAPLWVAYCHCHSCRRSTGAPVTIFVGYAKSNFRYINGKPEGYNSSPGITRSFCGRCGTPISYEGDWCPDEVHLYISTFDEPENFPPQVHVYTSEAIPWLKIDDSLPRRNEVPRKKDK